MLSKMSKKGVLQRETHTVGLESSVRSLNLLWQFLLIVDGIGAHDNDRVLRTVLSVV